MKGKTHVTVGVATALMVLHPDSVSGCLCAIAGGALGGWISDIDVRDDGRAHDLWQSGLASVGITGAALAIDAACGGDALAYVVSRSGVLFVAGLASFAVLCAVGSHTRHRGFTHSLVALALFSTAMWLFCAPLAYGFAVGFASHIVLDLLNYKRVQVLWPFGRGFSLKVCRSSSEVNRMLCIGATALSCLFLSWVGYHTIW